MPKHFHYFSGLVTAIIRLIKNPAYVLMLLGFVFLIAAAWGHMVFFPKYIEVQFHQTPAVANVITGKSTIRTFQDIKISINFSMIHIGQILIFLPRTVDRGKHTFQSAKIGYTFKPPGCSIIRADN